MLDTKLHRPLRHDLEARDLIARGSAQANEQFECPLRRIHADQRGDDILRQRKELQGGGRDDPEGALGAYKQGLGVIAGVVLAQTGEPRDYASIGEHDFEPEHEVAHHAVAKDRSAAGIGAQVSADLRGAFGAQAQRKQPVRVARG